MSKATVTVIGAVRRAAAIVEAKALQLLRVRDGELEGSVIVDPIDDALNVTLHVIGHAGTSYKVRIKYGNASVERGSRLVKDGAVRVYAIPLKSFGK